MDGYCVVFRMCARIGMSSWDTSGESGGMGWHADRLSSYIHTYIHLGCICLYKYFCC